jgi:hypothetical protein
MSVLFEINPPRPGRRWLVQAAAELTSAAATAAQNFLAKLPQTNWIF